MTYPQARTATRSGSTATARSGSMTHTTAPLRARTVSCSASRTPPGQWCSAGRSHRTRENCWRSMPTVSGSHRLLKAVTAAHAGVADGPLRVAVPRHTRRSRPCPGVQIPSGRALWLVAAGHTVWLEADGERSSSTLWRLQGPDATPTADGRYPANSDQGADIGEAPPTHAGNAAIGIYPCVTSPAYTSPVNAPQQIIRLSPDTAKQQTVPTVPAPPDGDSYGIGPPGVALGRAFYFSSSRTRLPRRRPSTNRPGPRRALPRNAAGTPAATVGPARCQTSPGAAT